MNPKSHLLTLLAGLFGSALFVVSLVPAKADDKHPSHPSGEETGVVVETLVKSGRSWDGTALPNYPEGKPEITILRITVPPKTRLPWHQHRVINAGVLLEGALTVVKDDGETLELKAGDALVEMVNHSHYGRNDSDKPAVIVVFYAGVEGEAVTVKEEAAKP